MSIESSRLAMAAAIVQRNSAHSSRVSAHSRVTLATISSFKSKAEVFPSKYKRVCSFVAQWFTFSHVVVKTLLLVSDNYL